MNIDRKALWAVRESGLPTIVKPCVDCSGTRHHPTGKIRVNANGKLLDVWLLLGCAKCDRTSKVPVHERVHVQSLPHERQLAYEANSAAVVRELTMSAALAARNGYRLDWTGTWSLSTDMPFYVAGPAGPELAKSEELEELAGSLESALEVLVGFSLPAPIRVERLLMLGLGVSRASVRRMVADGRIRLPVALALDAKVCQDFSFVVSGTA
jgi:hypothetical protein